MEEVLHLRVDLEIGCVEFWVTRIVNFVIIFQTLRLIPDPFISGYGTDLLIVKLACKVPVMFRGFAKDRCVIVIKVSGVSS